MIDDMNIDAWLLIKSNDRIYEKSEQAEFNTE